MRLLRAEVPAQTLSPWLEYKDIEEFVPTTAGTTAPAAAPFGARRSGPTAESIESGTPRTPVEDVRLMLFDGNRDREHWGGDRVPLLSRGRLRGALGEGVEAQPLSAPN